MDRAGSSVAAEWLDRARTVALQPPPGWCGCVYKPGWLKKCLEIESEDTLLTHALDPTPRRPLRVKPTSPLDSPYPN